ncbi:hypothetical protein IAQ61_004321 [Plenodomus lingam]|uniref:Uncharacterized protein n=1 Tax=Leptosphaeria maculans (strain JN3 / isolate v23.1.3 / race Av1-4-5-6-7-8) TaxID=985895 RepID=E4ZV70_LEPMJ|nr:hypothetical protein LEMA_P026480.1 [Plenodomus lingam JN3]KAH9873695.1 hypothetical protein IAQ61_004321 [Plenodomus lingam]CBX95496.1 hypothetical protein LEMA_P026480.1 [Plenodomus lingam JN3]
MAELNQDPTLHAPETQQTPQTNGHTEHTDVEMTDSIAQPEPQPPTEPTSTTAPTTTASDLQASTAPAPAPAPAAVPAPAPTTNTTTTTATLATQPSAPSSAPTPAHTLAAPASSRNSPHPSTAAQTAPTQPIPHGSPTRVYLNQNVTPHLLEAMKHLATAEPDKPLKWLSEFLAQKSLEIEGP